MLVCWINFAAVLFAHAFGKVSEDTWVTAMLLSILVTMMNIVEEVKRRPDATIELIMVVDRPTKVLDVKTKLNDKEPISSSGPSRADASAIEEDKRKMN
jgi:hypothetical protein